MIIYITQSALQDDAGFIFREKTITSLKKIVDAGHSLSIEGEGFGREQARLLEQEGIGYDTNEKRPDFYIDSDGNQLKLLTKEKEQVLSGGWEVVVSFLTTQARRASLERTTSETDISITINLDGTGQSEIQTGLNFFDHMLEQISRHGLIDMELKCDGDLEVDEHHTIEDVAIALGEVISKALGNKKGIERYGFVLPMDEAQSTVALDLSGRPYLVFEGEFKREYVGDMPTEMVKHFFYSLAMNLQATIHLSFAGENDHHQIEACFKGFARALKAAIEQNGRIKNLIPSSKGTL
ncbi:MAG: imidazoleglycerol-phosphate dehydratase HisB [Balneolaceae bacterium]|nr:imidazoleglycerol-phosphate dehydratase HisB [Balneolaceae bacterium]